MLVLKYYVAHDFVHLVRLCGIRLMHTQTEHHHHQHHACAKVVVCVCVLCAASDQQRELRLRNKICIISACVCVVCCRVIRAVYFDEANGLNAYAQIAERHTHTHSVDMCALSLCKQRYIHTHATHILRSGHGERRSLLLNRPSPFFMCTQLHCAHDIHQPSDNTNIFLYGSRICVCKYIVAVHR